MVSKATFSHQPCGQAGLLRTGSRGCGKFSRLARGGSWLRVLWPCRERGENLLWLTPKADGPLLAPLFLINWAGLSFGARLPSGSHPSAGEQPHLAPLLSGIASRSALGLGCECDSGPQLGGSGSAISLSCFYPSQEALLPHATGHRSMVPHFWARGQMQGEGSPHRADVYCTLIPHLAL